MKFVEFVKAFHDDQSGQDLIEYVLVVAAVAVGAVAGSGTLSSTLSNAVTTLNGRIQNCITATGTTC
ncbi:MAG: Flp family type IVb pilin [Terriglobales bacterium]